VSGSVERLQSAIADRYVIERELGAGGMATVYLAQDVRHDRKVAPLDSPQAARPLLRTPFEERSIALSPDGRWLAYVSDEAGSDQVYVRRLEEGSGRWKVSPNGGTEPRWGAGGRELLYRVAESIVATTLQDGAEPRFAATRVVLAGRFSGSRNGVTWDVSPDGSRFLFTRTENETGLAVLNVVLHWFDHQRAHLQ
jgi:Tol biopolymer transport system component